jgi:hypothetical protein
MSDTDNEAFSHRSGYVTPPLSPTKTVSTEGWFSPRTPGSPRKARSCLFTRFIDTDIDSLFFSPPASPTKSKSTPDHGVLTIPEIFHATSEPAPPNSDHDSPAKHHMNVPPRRWRSSGSLTLARTHSPPMSDADERPPKDPYLTPASGSNTSSIDERSPTSRRSSHRSFSDSLATASIATLPPKRLCSDTITGDFERLILSLPNVTNISEESPSPIRLRPFTPRCTSSPLRSSQWATHGGTLQVSSRGQACTPDRYIACRRPPAIARESFELNKPAKRLQTNQSIGGDPFSRRLRRSGRLNDELHHLREAHSLMIGRTGAQRRNANLAYRRSTSTLGTRQISAGAVWYVGGPSAVSDTVIGVSTGRGGMLGSGTNAPLYTSTFLNRADPEAELEAYEHRLALALDTDQTDRVLQHSLSSSRHQNERHGGTIPHAKYTWRDGVWIKDGVIPRLFLGTPRHTCNSC